MKQDEVYEDLLEYKKKGRKPLFLSGGPTVEEIISTYLKEKSVRRTAAKLQIAEGTVKKYIRITETPTVPGRNPDPSPWEARCPSKVALWVKERKEALPRSVKEIVRISGFSQDQVYLYLRRRVFAAKAYLQALGDLREKEGLALIDVKGRKIPVGMFAQYELDVDRFNLLVSITATLNFGGKANFKLSFGKYIDLWR